MKWSDSHVPLFARILEWVAFPFSKGSSWPRDQTQVYLHCKADALPVEPQGKPKNTVVGSLSLLQGIFPSQESNQGLLHFRQVLYQLSYKGSPKTLEWISYPFSRESSRPRNQTRVSWIAGGFFSSWAIREAPFSDWPLLDPPVYLSMVATFFFKFDNFHIYFVFFSGKNVRMFYLWLELFASKSIN